MIIKRGILLVLFVFLLVPFVFAANGCCGETTYGASCVYTAESSCATIPDAWAPTSQCEDAPFCKVGCCVKPDGMCADGSGEYTCVGIGGEWTQDACDQQPSCQQTCCQLGTTFIYTTEEHCQNVFNDADGIEYNSVSSEAECTTLAKGSDLGCCVSEELGCMYTSYADCGADIDPDTGLGFHNKEYCSDVAEVLDDQGFASADLCICEPSDHYECEGNDIRSFDSCGNPEEITECGYPDKVCSDLSGEPECISTYCSSTFKFENDLFKQFNSYRVATLTSEDEFDFKELQLGDKRVHGESWCVYESPVGSFRDRVGTQHYRAYCENGEEFIYPCNNARDQVCVVIYDENTKKYASDCVDNNHQEFYGSVEGEETAVGNKIIYDFDLPIEFGEGVNDYGVSTVPIATKFWEDDDASCSAATFDCKVWYGDNYEGKDEEGSKGWEAYVNTFCLRPEFVEASADYCGARGDCGINLNILGESGLDTGFDVRADPVTVGSTNQPGDDFKNEPIQVGLGGISQSGKDGGCFNPQILSEDTAYAMVQQGQNDVNQDYVMKKEKYPCKFYDTNEIADDYYSQLESEDVIVDTFARSFMTSSSLSYWTLLLQSTASMRAKDEVDPGDGDVCSDREDRLLPVVQTLGFNIDPTRAIEFMDRWVSSDPDNYWTSSKVRGGGWVVETNDYRDLIDDDSPSGVSQSRGSLLETPNGFMLYNYFRSIKPWYFDLAALGVDDNAGLSIGSTSDPSMYINFYRGDEVCGGTGSEWKRTKNHRKASTLTYTCDAWEPNKLDSSKCDLCDMPSTEGGLVLAKGEQVFTATACNEYRCHSLGNCEWIGENSQVAITDPTRPSCVANDECEGIVPPVLSYYAEPIEETLGSDYIPSESQDGYAISNIPSFQTFQFGVETDKITDCLFFDLDAIQDAGYTDFEEYVDAKAGVTTSTDQAYNTLVGLNMPEEGTGSTKNHKVTWNINEGDKKKTVITMCQDTCGKANVPYHIELTTSSAPDTTPPSIAYTIPEHSALVSYDTNETTLRVGLNEASICRYSKTKVDDYDNAETTFDDCDDQYEYNEFGYSECATSVLLDQTETLYILCADDGGYAMTEPHTWTVSKSPALEITQVSPEGPVYTNEVTIQMNTAYGVSDGDSICSYKDSDTIAYIPMENVESSYHDQLLTLPMGNYDYDIKCEDAIGNVVEGMMSFSVESDTTAAQISALYYLSGTLYVITDEASTCQYGTTAIDFGEGELLAGQASTDHSLTINDVDETYYIACIDAYGNEMDPISVDLEYLVE